MSPLRVRCQLVAGLSLLLVITAAHGQKMPLALRAGPVYTGSGGNGQPQFPKVDIVLDLVGGEHRDQTFAAHDLTLLEDGAATNQAAAVRSFAESGYGYGAIVVIDVSGSMKGAPLNAVRSSLYQFSHEVRPADKVGVATLADETRWDVPAGADPARLRDGLQKIKVRGNYTHLYDGLLDALAAFDDSFPARRELMVISDGHDEGSAHAEGDVIAEANRKGISVDAIGVTRSSEKYLQSLQRISSQTGGLYTEAKNVQDLKTLVEGGLSRVKASPVVTFVLARTQADGQRHKIGVHWVNTSAGTDLTAETSFSTPAIAATGSASPSNPLAPAGQAQHIKTRYWVSAGVLLAVIGLTTVMLLRRRKAKHVQPAAAQHAFPTPTRTNTSEKTGAKAAEKELANHIFVPNRTVVSEAPPAPPARTHVEMEPVGSAGSKTRMLHLFDERTEEGAVGWLDCISGGLQGKRFAVKGPEFWMGAADNNDLRIDDVTVSGNHACIRVEGRVLVVADNNSTNGTKINDVVLRGGRKPLSPGDVIQMGRTRFCLSKNISGQAGKQ